MIFISNLMYVLFMLSAIHLSIASLYALHKIEGGVRAKRHAILFSISLIILFYYRQSTLDILSSIPVYAALCIVLGYLGHDAIKEGKRYTKTATERAK